MRLNLLSWSSQRFIQQEKGGIALLFIIIIPIFFVLFAFAFDSSYLMLKKARLNDGMYEGTLAVASYKTTANASEDKIKYDAMLKSYIENYLPDNEVKYADISLIQGNDGIPRYNAKAGIELKMLLPLKELPSFEESVDINGVGKVRKGITVMPADYVFVVDFSGSMMDPSSESGMSRIQLLKKVVNELVQAALHYNDSEKPNNNIKFAIVPFDRGVPVRLNKLNEAGGEEFGCSVMFAPKDGYGSDRDIEERGFDYAFWAGKPDSNEMPNKIRNLFDRARYQYYTEIIGPATGRSIEQMVSDGWCKPLSYPVAENSVPFSCEADEKLRLDSDKYKDDARFTLGHKMYSHIESVSDGENIANISSMDIDTTLEHMFTDKYVHTFIRSIIWEYGAMCRSAVDQELKLIMPTFPQDYKEKRSEYYQRQINHLIDNIRSVKPKTYLIELTDDINKLDEFQKMTPLGGTDSSSGLLRAIPVITKGQNKNKVIIIISDGDDNKHARVLSEKLHSEEINVCEKIRTGMKKHSPNTEKVSIHFISIAGSHSSDAERVAFWGEKCTGVENAYTAANYHALTEAIRKIATGFEETGFFDNDE